ncbi:hypothetical protein M0R45_025512 [Rubus argutus]|uniref:Uncharacterized protein n=1 Tax=Rubus argutus TaxID=59490 RepID=A0AAW1WWH4_RUBAR
MDGLILRDDGDPPQYDGYEATISFDEDDIEYNLVDINAEDNNEFAAIHDEDNWMDENFEYAGVNDENNEDEVNDVDFIDKNYVQSDRGF